MRKLTVLALIMMFLALPVKSTFAADAAIPLTFSGYVVTQGTANFGDNGGDNANNYYTFSDDESTFTPSAQLGVANEFFVIDALFGSMASDLGTDDNEFFLHQAYAVLPVGPFTVMVGHMDTMLGNEVINPGDNPNITRSFLFGYSINFQNTGIRAMMEPGILFDEVYLGLSNGSDVIYDEGTDQQKIIEAAAGMTIGEGSLFLAMNYGNDGTDANTIMQTYTAVMGYPVSDTLDLTLNGVYGKETKSGTAIDGEWFGYAAYLTKSLSDTMSVTVRYEYFQDEGDTKLEFGDANSGDSTFVNLTDDGTVESFTITPEMAIGGGVLRAEYRMDFANFKAFQAGEGTAPQNKEQQTASLQYIVAF